MSSLINDATPPGTPTSTAALHIGEVAARTELSLRTLRHYDEVGLLRPSGRTIGGFRLYTQDDIDRILVIRRMKPLGFTLEEMAAVMADFETLRAPTQGTARADEGAARDRLDEVLEQATERRARLQTQLAMADEFIAILSTQLRGTATTLET